MQLAKLLVDYIVPVCAIVGCGLGLFNSYMGLRDRRVHLVVKPMREIRYGVPDAISVEVLNRSRFPVYIDEIGLTFDGRTIRKGRGPFTLADENFPKRLEPGAGCRVSVNAMELREHWHKIGRAYAETTCGSVCYGNSDALKQMQAELRRGVAPETSGLRGHTLVGAGQVGRTANRV